MNIKPLVAGIFLGAALTAGAGVLVLRPVQTHAAAVRDAEIRRAILADFGAPAPVSAQLDAIDTWHLVGALGQDYQRLQGEATRSAHWQDQMFSCYRELQAYKSGSIAPQQPATNAAAVTGAIWDRILPGSGAIVKKLTEKQGSN